jgi:hypothetical protein
VGNLHEDQFIYVSHFFLGLEKLQPHHRTNHNDVILIILITITLESSNNKLPDDGD